MSDEAANKTKTFWDNLFDHVAAAIKTKITDGLINLVLGSIIRIEEQELTLLKKIDADVTSIKEGPYHTGREYLAQANQPYLNKAERGKQIDAAKASFMQALGMEKRGYHRALIQSNIAHCWLMLGNRDAALDWYRKAIQSAEDYLGCLRRRPTGIRVADAGVAATFGVGAISLFFPPAALLIFLTVPAGAVGMGVGVKQSFSASKQYGICKPFLDSLNEKIAPLLRDGK